MNLRLYCISILFLSGCVSVSNLDRLSIDKRAHQIKQYLSEFSSPVFNHSHIAEAINDVMMRLPEKDLENILNRRRPVVFVEVYDEGTAKYVSSSELIMTAQDKPAFQEGMTLIKISTALEQGSKEAVMGIVAHELAHRVLDHVRRGRVTCQSEREANQLIKSWGFETEYKAASTEFGRMKEGSGVASCQE